MKKFTLAIMFVAASLFAQTITDKIDNFYQLPQDEQIEFIFDFQSGKFDRKCGPKDVIKVQKLIARLARMGATVKTLPMIREVLEEMEKYNHPKDLLSDIFHSLPKNKEALEDINWVIKYHHEFEFTPSQLQALKKFRAQIKRSRPTKAQVKKILLILS